MSGIEAYECACWSLGMRKFLIGGKLEAHRCLVGPLVNICG